MQQKMQSNIMQWLQFDGRLTNHNKEQMTESEK